MDLGAHLPLMQFGEEGQSLARVLLSSYADAGCRRAFIWPLGDEARQLELVASEVALRIER